MLHPRYRIAVNCSGRGYGLISLAMAVFVVSWIIANSARAASITTNLMSVSTATSNYGYGASDTNSCAIAHNNLISFGNYQYIAFYGPNTGTVSNPVDAIYISRRTLGTNNWTTPINTGITITDINDDHNVIALGVDSTGHMHMSWDMHNISLKYAISSGVVDGPTFSSLAFTQQTSATAPTLFPGGGSTTNEVTYPEFHNIPGSNNMIFAYRNGGSGGGSGNGDQYLDIYNPATTTWTNTKIINGQQTSVNAYLNGFVYDSTNTLLTTWTWRATPNWQTNSNIMFAQSQDNGSTWFQQGGSPQYTLPIIQSGSPSTSVAQVVWPLPQNTSFINQTTMAVDIHDHPIVATYWAPGTTGTTNATLAPNSTTNNPNLQYMLVYFDGSVWRTSQITHRTSDTAFDGPGGNSGQYVRDLGRPIVLVDQQDRVLVVTRCEDTAQGSYKTASTPNNNIVIYYNDDLLSGNTISDADWKHFTLPRPDQAYENLGNYEPTYDSSLWKSTGTLDLFYQPMGLTGQTSAPVSVLEWNEQRYFAIAEPKKGDLDLDGSVTAADISALMAALADLDAYKAKFGLTGDDLVALSDVDSDSVVTNADLQSLIVRLANGGGGSLAAVPEPTSFDLAVIAMALAATRGVVKSRTRRS